MEDEFEDETFSMDDDEFTFGLVGSITKKLRQMIEKIKCSVRVAGETIADGELKDVFQQYRKDIFALLKNDVNECIHTKGLKAKIEWVAESFECNLEVRHLLAPQNKCI